jgi:hypothetical protein
VEPAEDRSFFLGDNLRQPCLMIEKRIVFRCLFRGPMSQ